MKAPGWTVLYNIVSPGAPEFVGTGWEFFGDEIRAHAAYDRHIAAGNIPTCRPYHDATDRRHLCASHRALLDMQPMPSKRQTITDDPNHPGINVPTASGQNETYLVLSEAERAKGFVRPYRDSYKHVGAPPKYPLFDLTDEQKARVGGGNSYVKFEKYPPERGPALGRYWTAAELARKGCGAVTTMGRLLSETYARQPSFYGSTFCVGCGAHHEVAEFVWTADGQVVGS